MTAISSSRAGLFSQAVNTAQTRSNSAASAGQAAFFRAALGGDGAAVATRAQQTKVEAPVKREAVANVSFEAPAVDAPAPSRFLRPGSLLDIRV